MVRKREKLQAYFAGIFDGEGSVGVYNTSGAWRLALGIHMQEPLPIGLLWREYPESTLKEWVLPNGKSRFQFNLYGTSARRFLEEIKPYSIVKHEQVVLALAFLNHQSRYQANKRRFGLPHGAYPADYHTRCDNLAQKLKDEKKPIGVNSVETWVEKSRQYRSKLDEAASDVILIRERLEGVETRHSESVEATSAPEKDIVPTTSM